MLMGDSSSTSSSDPSQSNQSSATSKARKGGAGTGSGSSSGGGGGGFKKWLSNPVRKFQDKKILSQPTPPTPSESMSGSKPPLPPNVSNVSTTSCLPKELSSPHVQVINEFLILSFFFFPLFICVINHSSSSSGILVWYMFDTFIIHDFLSFIFFPFLGLSWSGHWINKLDK